MKRALLITVAAVLARTLVPALAQADTITLNTPAWSGTLDGGTRSSYEIVGHTFSTCSQYRWWSYPMYRLRNVTNGVIGGPVARASRRTAVPRGSVRL